MGAAQLRGSVVTNSESGKAERYTVRRRLAVGRRLIHWAAPSRRVVAWRGMACGRRGSGFLSRWCRLTTDRPAGSVRTSSVRTKRILWRAGHVDGDTEQRLVVRVRTCSTVCVVALLAGGCGVGASTSTVTLTKKTVKVVTGRSVTETVTTTSGSAGETSATNLVVTPRVRIQLRSAVTDGDTAAEAAKVKGPLPSRTYYAEYQGYRYALATFSFPVTGTQDQPLLFVQLLAFRTSWRFPTPAATRARCRPSHARCARCGTSGAPDPRAAPKTAASDPSPRGAPYRYPTRFLRSAESWPSMRYQR